VIQNVVDFTIVAFTLFVVVKGLNRLRRQTPPVKVEVT